MGAVCGTPARTDLCGGTGITRFLGRRGFGSQLLERGMAPGATVRLDYHPEGLECRVTLPLGTGHMPETVPAGKPERGG